MCINVDNNLKRNQQYIMYIRENQMNMLTFSENVSEGSYLPPIGFAAARTEHLA